MAKKSSAVLRSYFDHTAIEAKWREKWLAVEIDSVDTSATTCAKDRERGLYYNLMMFPYPSAEGLHVGNMYAFTGADIFGRFKRMQGYNVFEPIGLDGFGIHSENYALKLGNHPADQAKISAQNFYRQLASIGCMFDWGKTLETHDPDYYRWTQWIFVQMFKHGLAYRAKAKVNWCPSCKTVLADEQVIDEACERCGNKVSNRLLEQWFFRITAYAEKLLENSFSLDWSRKVKIAQQNWIGKKEGIDIKYSVVDENGKQLAINHQQLIITCFTTRPDTNFGATFVVVAPEHPFIASLLKIKDQEPKIKDKEIEKYVEEAKKKSKEERITGGRKKTGVFAGLYCVNQLNNYKMPIYISDFVISEAGTGAVVGVPGHDKRDFEFAQTFDLPVIRVVVAADGDASPITNIDQVQEADGNMMNSGFLNGMDIRQATKEMMDYLEQKGWGKRVVTYHLRDWLISRQRYWGPPIPMIYCENCAKAGKSWFTTEEVKPYIESIGGWPACQRLSAAMAGRYPVPDDQLPVLLPYIKDYKPSDDGVAPLAKHREFYETKCPGCDGKAVRETDVSDTFLDSSWYFLKYPSVAVEKSRSGGAFFGDAKQAQSKPSDNFPSFSESSLPWDPVITKKWLPVHMYTGGAEHSVLHLMYSRFVTMALHDWGYVDFDEPFTRFYAHGLVIKDGAKMSKSKCNVVTPDEYIRLYGADSLRLYLMFMGPYDQGGDFQDAAMEGMYRWVGRVWRMAQKIIKQQSQETSTTLAIALQKVIKKVGEDIENRRYNTAIASMMEFTNVVADEEYALSLADVKILLLLLAPFAPYFTEELWQQVNKKSEDTFTLSKSIHIQPWPAFDPRAIVEQTVSIVVQVNGKVRDIIIVKSQKSKVKSEVEQEARASVKVSKYLTGQTVKKVIFVPGKIVNFVV
ncbi:leucine--tRNA ligase [Patescibacteria group bacterium]|nr:leucine--tRNA ligase [Patescibacteria group bacterium]MBU1472391.1 leucine--tRNA ligase [Patescibacteria group bacterium]MBU2459874.1 leucine--tRNA ligase [Patescibacteria group bacterium]